MHRKLLDIVAVVCLVLCLALVVLWVRSWGNGRSGDRLAFVARGDQWELRSEGGGISLYRRDRFPWFFSGPSTGGKAEPRYNWNELFGVHYWLPTALTAVLPVVRIARWRKLRRRVAAGLCLRCGYDLRASPGRCPECGDVAVVGAVQT